MPGWFTAGNGTDRKALTGSTYRLDGYFNKVKDKMVAMPADNQFRWMMLNLGYVEIRGVDAVASIT